MWIIQLCLTELWVVKLFCFEVLLQTLCRQTSSYWYSLKMLLLKWCVKCYFFFFSSFLIVLLWDSIELANVKPLLASPIVWGDRFWSYLPKMTAMLYLPQISFCIRQLSFMNLVFIKSMDIASEARLRHSGALTASASQNQLKYLTLKLSTTCGPLVDRRNPWSTARFSSMGGTYLGQQPSLPLSLHPCEMLHSAV